jgi:hypothetical protein
MDLQLVSELGREDLERHLDPARVRTLQILQIALTVGPLLFAGVIALVYFTQPVPPEAKPPGGDESITNILLAGLGALVLAVLSMAAMLGRLWVKPARLARLLEQAAGPQQVTAALLQDQFQFTLLRLALSEGLAVFGLVIVLVAVIHHSLASEPQAWLGAVPLVIHLFVSVVTFFDRASLAERIHTTVIQPLQRSI